MTNLVDVLIGSATIQPTGAMGSASRRKIRAPERISWIVAGTEGRPVPRPVIVLRSDATGVMYSDQSPIRLRRGDWVAVSSDRSVPDLREAIHELRNDLSMVAGALELIIDSPGIPDDLHALTAAALRRAEKATGLASRVMQICGAHEAALPG